MEENKILLDLYKNRFNYCHALEVYDVEELKNIIENLVLNFSEYSEEDILDFFETIQIYYLGSSQLEEVEVFNFCVVDYVQECLNNMI